MCIYFFISFPHILKFILYQSLVMFGENGRKLNCGWITYFTGGGGGGGGLGFCRTIRMIFVGCRDGRSFTSRDPGRTWIFGRTILICRTCKRPVKMHNISYNFAGYLKPCLHVKFFSPYPLLQPLKFSIVPTVMCEQRTEWVMNHFPFIIWWQ